MMAQYDENGSFFTKNLVACLDMLDSRGEEISLYSIYQKLKSTVGDKPCMETCYAKGEILIKPKINYEQQNEFVTAFWNTINMADHSNRAIMWYALNASCIGFDTKMHILEELLCKHFYEGSWLARRAIGHVLSSLPQEDVRVNSLEKQLLNSSSWINMCIGLIATRFHSDSAIQKQIQSICANEELPMDVVWLANLYAMDHLTDPNEVIFPKAMLESEWGVIDLYLRSEKYPAVLKVLEQSIPNRLHGAFEQHEIMLGEKSKTQNQLLKQYLNSPKRGRIPSEYNDKWLRSVLFGQWRDHPQIDLQDYFKNTPARQIRRELEALRTLDAVDIKLGVLSYVSTHNQHKTNKDALLWALDDPHPWVRRDAFPIFSKEPERIKHALFGNAIDRRLYPGVLDMLIQAKPYLPQIDINDFLSQCNEQFSLTEAELESVKTYYS